MDLGVAVVKVSTTGIDEVLNQMGKMQQLTGETAKAMLRAGGNVFQRQWMTQAERARHVRTGDMLRSIGQTNPRDKGGGLQIENYPQGKGRSGVRNSVKAFVLHHGRKGRAKIQGDRWVDDVVQSATEEANTAMANVWGQFITTGKAPVVKKLPKGKK